MVVKFEGEEVICLVVMGFWEVVDRVRKELLMVRVDKEFFVEVNVTKELIFDCVGIILSFVDVQVGYVLDVELMEEKGMVV